MPASPADRANLTDHAAPADHATLIDLTDPATRAAKAEHSVDHLFGSRAFGIPGTYLGAVVFPRSTGGPWHYWWQAHLLDALVDAAVRERGHGNADQAAQLRTRAHRLLRGIALHSGGRVSQNLYFDDMAWLALALGRVRDEDIAATGRTTRAVLDAGAQLYPRLTSACDANLGGGTWWNTSRKFKNVAATAPTALALLRAHRLDEAAQLTNWLFDTLWSEDRAVFHDGIHMIAAGSGAETTRLETAVFSYNSGPVLGTCLELAAASTAETREAWLDRAEQIVRGAAEEFSQPGPDHAPVLRTHGAGDGGLFTGILARYLAQAAACPLLADDARATARALVTATADAFWAGRREFDPAVDFSRPGTTANSVEGETVAVFSPDPAEHANQAQRAGAPIELCTQLQAWTVLEAAARCSAQR